MIRTQFLAASIVAIFALAPVAEAASVSVADPVVLEAFDIGGLVELGGSGFDLFTSGPLMGSEFGFFAVLGDDSQSLFDIDGEVASSLVLIGDNATALVFAVGGGENGGFQRGTITVTGLGVDSTGISDGDFFDQAKLTYAPIPLPAAGWMLLAGLGALVSLRRGRA